MTRSRPPSPRSSRCAGRGIAALLLAVAAPLGGGHAQTARSTTLAANAAFAGGRYDEALRLYRLAAERGEVRCYDRDFCFDELIETVEARRRLGAIAPADTHRIGLIFVTEIHTVDKDGRVARRPDATRAHKERWRVEAALVRQLIEAFSNGGMTLAFDEVDAIFTHQAGGPDTAWYTDQLDLAPYFRRNANVHDSYVTLSTTIPFGLGLARRYPFVAYVLYGPNRGVAQLNPDWDWRFLLHEWFHSVEFIANIQPAHGYMDSIRVRFPGWTGRTEFDYFRWHFRTTLAGDWSRLSYSRRWPAAATPWNVDALERIARWYADVPAERRRAAQRMFESARSLRDTAQRVSELERLLSMSPFHAEALRAIDRIYQWRRPEAHRWSSQLATVDDAEGSVAAAAAAPTGTRTPTGWCWCGRRDAGPEADG